MPRDDALAVAVRAKEVYAVTYGAPFEAPVLAGSELTEIAVIAAIGQRADRAEVEPPTTTADCPR